MSLSLEHVDICIPITALEPLDLGHSQFVVQGQGPFLRVIDDRTGDALAQVQAFRRNNVHGFITLSQRHHENGSSHVQVMAWGGQSLRVIDLHLSSGHAVTLTPSSAEFLAPDWIMSGCTAVADQPDTVYWITANNALLSSKLVQSKSLKHQTDILIYQLATSVKSILYAADLVAISTSHVLIAAGTVFGEIIVWSCFIDSNRSSNAAAIGSIHHFFTGHDGSIFGVQISSRIPSLNGGQSGRLLASCSDDRTVRIWDISDCEHTTSQDPSAYSTDGFELRTTGFGVTADESGVRSESCVAKAFGHVARIWNVYFRPIKKHDSCMMGLVTHGEDSSCVLWDLHWETSSSGTTAYQLRDGKLLHRHSGKHIWSLGLFSRGEETVVYTGGADGALKRFIIDESDSPLMEHQGAANPRHSKCSESDELKDFAFVAPNCLIGYATKGELQIGNVSSGENVNVTWQTLCVIEDLRSFVTIAGFPRQGLALIGNAQGRIRLYNHSTKSVSELVDIGSRLLRLFVLESNTDSSYAPSESISFIVSYPTNDRATLVTVSGWTTESPQTEIFTLTLPVPIFAVSSASFLLNREYVMLGSKQGCLAVYRIGSLGLSPQPLTVKRYVHDRKGTTHIKVLTDTSSAGLEYVLTSGRDETFCVHEVRVGGHGDEVSLETVHQTSSALAGPIEGFYHDEITGDLMLYGFRSQAFVLRNESKQADIVSIPSGGARRTWSFHPNTRNDSRALVVWKEKSHLRTLQVPTDLQHTLRAGGHGREIKTAEGLNPIPGRQPLYATGAEDTIVRIFAPSPQNAGPWGSFESVRVLQKHISGVQQVSWSKDGQYLFTSAAYEEFYVWKVGSVPSFGITTVLVATGPKDDPKSELRITSFDVVDVEEHDSSRAFLLCLVLSNSTIRILHFSPADDYKITLLARGKYMTNCLTQAHFTVKDASINLTTAATDGYVTVWDLTSTLENFYSINSSILKVRSPLKGLNISPGAITYENRYQIHSNSIKGMELVSLSDTATVILASGDDNSFSVSLVKTTPTNTNPYVATISIPDAHAASVTALKVLRHQKSQPLASAVNKVTVATSGNDHRLKIWSITVEPSQPDTDGLNVELLLDRYSSVADISSLVLMKDQPEDSSASCNKTEAKLVICGVGMELLEVDLR
ncbi:uncharacterized protein N7459_008818 [Penicillium hispanicum]|uniref:uncharacterized protein n=1 Tax=Penicillium hispanicum TaxID=1080232 RepID=UPI00253F6993|nr:uncharacterized protein N7459_008818 [Penicillium hispanicum]KAJ5574391.1 hypothetical protein N7459_008818 [Penicillium hispanicum]